MIKDILIYDIETDSLDTNKAKLKWFGAYSLKENKYYLFDCVNTKYVFQQIETLINNHKVLVGFNNKNYDNPILEKFGIIFDYKIIIDLFEISAPKGAGGFGKNNKNRLQSIGIKLKSFSLKNIADVLKLDNNSKGDINYNIFKKDKWNKKEQTEIKKYLKQDIILTKKLFEWYEEQFKPLKKFLSKKDADKFVHLKSSLPSLSYQIICNKAGLPVEWDDVKKDKQSFAGGHHINSRQNKIAGNIIEIDFNSAYPHALMMGNLFSPSKEGWDGKNYFKLQGCYNNKTFGKIEQALKDIYGERLKAKKAHDEIKNQAYKLVINSLYGLTGNSVFKSLYNPTTASDCTSVVRTWMKKLAKTLEENEFECLYGFTDSIFVKIADESHKEELMFVVDKFIETVKNNMPFPINTFGMDVEKEIKFIWFVSKNCYLFVTQDDEVEYKSTLLNVNTPKAILNLFNNYMKPKIIKELDINFSQNELVTQLKNVLKDNPELSAEEYKVSNLSEYKVETSLHYQISKLYGEGRHLLIPNIKSIGVGRAKSTKKKVGVRYCNYDDFKLKKLNVDCIDFDKLMIHLKPFLKNE